MKRKDNTKAVPVGDTVDNQMIVIEGHRMDASIATEKCKAAERDLIAYLASQGYHEMLKLDYTEIRRQFG